MKPPPMVKVVCRCGKEFERSIYEYNKNVRTNSENFCSRKCYRSTKMSTGIRDKGPRGRLVRNKEVEQKEANPFKLYMGKVRDRAKKKGLEVDITHEYLKTLWDKQDGRCAYTGAKLVHKGRRRNPNKEILMLQGASLDRIDASKGYIVGNVQFVGFGINFAKSDFSNTTAKEFIDFIRNGDLNKNYVKTGLVKRMEDLVPI